MLAAVLVHGRALAQGTGRSDSTRAAADTGATAPSPIPSAVPLGPDSTGTAADSARRDSLGIRRDTIKAPLAHAPLPPSNDLRGSYRWNRKALFATGATTLGELLQRIPGVTTFRSGWLASPEFAAYLGNPERTRVFYDGVEVDPVDPRAGGILDLGNVPLWTLEDVAVERGADEVRIYLRSWRVNRTTPQTRTDVLSGDQQTNLYRGFFGKRFGGGEAAQFGVQSYGTASDANVGGGGDLTMLARVGWATGLWSLDAFATRSNRTRDLESPQLGSGEIPQQKRTLTNAYVRAGYGDPDAGPWAQLTAATERFRENTPFTAGGVGVAPDSADTTRNIAQYVASGGLTRGPLRVSATDRYHALFNGTHLNALSARATYSSRLAVLSLRAEHRGGVDTSSTEELALRVAPLPFLAFGAALTHRHGGTFGDPSPSVISERGEAELSLGRMAFTGGILRRDAVRVPGLIAYDTGYVTALAGSASGVFGEAKGKFYKDVGVDAWAVRWNAPGFYRPQIQSRVELYLDTRWIHRFPRNDFGLLASVADEYRGIVLFPTAGASESLVLGSQATDYGHVLVSRLEIRILSAFIFIDNTYALSPPQYAYVPGYLQPRQRFIYGVRWQFWN